MRNRLLLSCAVLLFTSVLSQAQIAVELLIPEDSYIPGETIQVGVKLSNRSGQTLEMATIPDWVDIMVETGDHHVARKLSEISVPGTYSITNGMALTRRFDINPFFEFKNPGHYTLSTSVKIPQLGRSYTSDQVSVNVLPGFTLWEQSVGVPPSDPENPQGFSVRKYELIKASRSEKNYLYSKVSNESGTIIYGVTQITRMLGISRPEHLLDNENNLHIFCQNERIDFNYSVISPDGKLIKRETWVNVGIGRPNIAFDEARNVRVVDAQRRLTANDFPAVTNVSLQN